MTSISGIVHFCFIKKSERAVNTTHTYTVYYSN